MTAWSNCVILPHDMTHLSADNMTQPTEVQMSTVTLAALALAIFLAHMRPARVIPAHMVVHTML